MAGEMEVAKGMLRTLIKVTFGYPAIGHSGRFFYACVACAA
ncbi:TPA: hypothetical protein ACGD94_000980 [Salmonella enterica subsp. enterica]